MRKTKLEINFQVQDTGYPMGFVNSAVNHSESKEHDPMIPGYLFNDFQSKPIILIDVPFCNENDKLSKQIPKKLKAFTKEKHDFRNCLENKESETTFPFEGEKSIFYHGLCSCKKNYIGETKRNVITGWNEHENAHKD